MRYFTEMYSRYSDCRFWYGSILHSAFHAVFNPAHANKNLHPNNGFVCPGCGKVH